VIISDRCKIAAITIAASSSPITVQAFSQADGLIPSAPLTTPAAVTSSRYVEIPCPSFVYIVMSGQAWSTKLKEKASMDGFLASGSGAEVSSRQGSACSTRQLYWPRLFTICCRNATPRVFSLYWPGVDTQFMLSAHPHPTRRSQEHRN
jgi:hypothetical protein